MLHCVTAFNPIHGIEPVLGYFLPNLSPMELIIIVFIGILLFGKRLPEVGRSLGKGIVEFKKGLRGVEEEVEEASSKNESQRATDRIDNDAPKFEVPRQANFDKNDQPV